MVNDFESDIKIEIQISLFSILTYIYDKVFHNEYLYNLILKNKMEIVIILLLKIFKQRVYYDDVC